jgi:hypothetical protein
MSLALVVALLIVVVAFLIVIDRKDRRHDIERQVLLNRIQAPDVAVAQTFGIEPSSEPLYVPVDDDKAWWDSQNGSAN